VYFIHLFLKISGPHIHLSVVYLAVMNEVLRTESQQCNCSIICKGSAAECACPETKRWQLHHWTT